MVHTRTPCYWICSERRVIGMSNDMNLFAIYTYGYKYDTFKYYLIWVLTRKNRENGFADSISPFKVNS